MYGGRGGGRNRHGVSLGPEGTEKELGMQLGKVGAGVRVSEESTTYCYTRNA